MSTLGIHVFRRDLRLEDNTALNALIAEVDTILPVFIFDDRQVLAHPYQSTPGLQILCESLEDLDRALREKGSRLHVWRGVAEDVLRDLVKEYSPVLVSYNKDYTPFSVRRDEALNAVCAKAGVQIIAEHDSTLHAPGTLVTAADTPCRVYTRYRIAAEAQPPARPARLPRTASFALLPGGESLETVVSDLVPNPRTLRVSGGRSVAKEMLKKLSHNQRYENERNIPSLSSTSLLSASIKFGTLSIREVYHYAKEFMPTPEPFLRELFWHDFFTAVAALSPYVYEGAYKKEFDALEWNTDEAAFERWKTGTTGFPIVDAGMRELLETGYMHNRLRMITASFLVKDLHISWQWGERYFAQMLSDYDPAVNNGNWQWVAGTGCDASPWFRIFNPWLQQQKFDSDAAYIKKWIPELASLSPKEIHSTSGDVRKEAGYPLPMCDHATEAKETKVRFGAV